MAPLSEHEQKILEEIEAGLYAADPRFGDAGRGNAVRQSRIGAIAFVVGLICLIVFLMSRSLLVGVASFILMVGGIVLVVGGVRGVLSSQRSYKARARERVGRTLGDWERRLRERYKRPE